ncbi:MAG: hypothetical protein JWR60_2093 [Polaromonas sp.]|nr:hypothetical protein [Polaromonas sp.]
MEPMKPMEPMAPMKPMKPMAAPDESWWPSGLSKPSSSGAQNGVRYAFFPDQHRLAVEQDGQVTQYDTGRRQITGASQAQGSGAGALRFATQDGDIELASLKQVH